MLSMRDGKKLMGTEGSLLRNLGCRNQNRLPTKATILKGFWKIGPSAPMPIAAKRPNAAIHDWTAAILEGLVEHG
jgi:hypothetical protein